MTLRMQISAALCAVAARAQSPLLVGYQKTIQVSVPGATAAYSLDSMIAEASAVNGLAVPAFVGSDPSRGSGSRLATSRAVDFGIAAVSQHPH